jgi:hypothetical protein
MYMTASHAGPGPLHIRSYAFESYAACLAPQVAEPILMAIGDSDRRVPPFQVRFAL